MLAVVLIGFAVYFVSNRLRSEAEAELQRDLKEAASLVDQQRATLFDTFTRTARLIADLPKFKAVVDESGMGAGFLLPNNDFNGIKAPLLAVHGLIDDTVPAQADYATWVAAPPPKFFLALPNQGHNEPFFPTPDDFEAHDALVSIAEGAIVADENRRRLSPEHWFKPRKAMIELAWLWLRYQPESRLARWFTDRVGAVRGRIRKITAVALARKLLVALWRHLMAGLLPEGARVKTA